jgi:hypothetical protein
MSADEEKKPTSFDDVISAHGEKGLDEVRHADNILLARLGYKSQFRREFSVGLALRRLIA